jgi:hypothetical protein
VNLLLARMKRTILLLTLCAAVVPAYSEEGFRLQAKQGRLAYYTGEATISGDYEWRFDDETLQHIGDLVCFYPKEASASLIPRAMDDKRVPWFCFSQQEDARKMLKIPSKRPNGNCTYTGEATIVIADYVVNLRESEVNDEARLVKVISASIPKNLKCE